MINGRFNISDTPLLGLKVVQRNPIGDSRGYLERLFCSVDLKLLLAGKHIEQVNHTLTSKRGTVRGMHLQRSPHAEIKWVQCLRGTIFDVAVDMRQGSNTFLRWHAEILSDENHKTMYIPEGFAHGFQTLTDQCDLLYFHTACFQPQSEQGFNAQDPMLAIQWPEAITEQSMRDASHQYLTTAFTGIVV